MKERNANDIKGKLGAVLLYITHRKISARKFEKEARLSNGTITNTIKRGSDLSQANIEKIENHFGANFFSPQSIELYKTPYAGKPAEPSVRLYNVLVRAKTEIIFNANVYAEDSNGIAYHFRSVLEGHSQSVILYGCNEITVIPQGLLKDAIVSITKSSDAKPL